MANDPIIPAASAFPPAPTTPITPATWAPAMNARIKAALASGPPQVPLLPYQAILNGTARPPDVRPPRGPALQPPPPPLPTPAPMNPNPTASMPDQNPLSPQMSAALDHVVLTHAALTNAGVATPKFSDVLEALAQRARGFANPPPPPPPSPGAPSGGPGLMLPPAISVGVGTNLPLPVASVGDAFKALWKNKGGGVDISGGSSR